MADVINLNEYRASATGLQVGRVHDARPCGVCRGLGGYVTAQVAGSAPVVTGMPCMACGRVGKGSAA